MGVAAKGKIWERETVLNVAFIGGTPDLHARVFRAAQAWLEPGIKLSFNLVASGEKAQIRVSFDPNAGSWSYVGTDALGVYPWQATMNLGWATMATPEPDFLSVVIHEFGHALGLLHEHNHPEAGIDWRSEVVYADLGRPPNNWTKAEVDANVFAAFPKKGVVTTPFDDVSVMIYTIPAHWTKNGRRFMPSHKLSRGDSETIRALYA